VLLKGDLAFGNESLANARASLANTLAFDEGIRLWETQTEDDDENWWGSSEPEEWSPSVRSGVDKGTSKDLKQN